MHNKSSCLNQAIVASLLAASMVSPAFSTQATPMPASPESKAVVYQVFTRLFGNENTTNKPWGTIEDNGVGKFSDFTDQALAGIKELGVSHIWYTGVPHHATITDYTAFGIVNDDPDVVKGRAGSPYAIKDYYSVAPDLADDPKRRMDEFRDLVARTHRHGMKVIIDIVPNHVARGYRSAGKPPGIRDFGADDDTGAVYRRENDFYYVPNQPFVVPDLPATIAPLGGEKHPLADGHFLEVPAKWTGNGARAAKPKADDWYETAKLNYGVRPDGSYDFPTLPPEYANQEPRAHVAFWEKQDIPETWRKMRDIAFFWLDQGVDGFRYDVAELVPVEFWSYLNSAIKARKPDAFLLAEVYNPKLYRDYIYLGKMDYLYDKVGLYDTLKAIIQNRENTDALVPQQASVADIEHHMLHFLENHDEQRIASPDFAGTPERALPAMVVSATLGTSPTMLYFGQTVGEDGSEDGGFGDPTRTSIFDYVGVPAHQRWMNGGKFDGGALSKDEACLRKYYAGLMTFVAQSKALRGHYQDLHTANRAQTEGYTPKTFSFARWEDDERLIIISNFAEREDASFKLTVPSGLIAAWQLADGSYDALDQISDLHAKLEVAGGEGIVEIELASLQSVILKIR